MADPTSVEQVVDVNGILKAGLMADMKVHASNTQAFVGILNNTTLLAVQRSALPSTLAGLATAHYTPDHASGGGNPFPAPKPAGT